MYSQTTLIGNLGRDPDLRFLPNGTAATTLHVASDERWTDRDGQKQHRTTWWQVHVFGKQAENAAHYLEKGRQVLVTGTLQADPETGGPKLWQGKDGHMHAAFALRAERVRFLGGSDNGHAAASDAPNVDDSPF